MKRNIPIMKKKVSLLIKELDLSPVEVLQVLEPICEHYRKCSRENVERDVSEWKKKKGIPAIKTDY